MKNKTFIKEGVTCKKLGGYIFVQIGIIWMPQHRLVVESHIKRELTKEEVIHHLNFDKTDNRIENLMLFKNQAEHIKFHLKIRQFGMTQPIKRQIRERWNSLNTFCRNRNTFPPGYNSPGGLNSWKNKNY